MDRVLLAILLLMFIILGYSNRVATTTGARVIKIPTKGAMIRIDGYNTRGFGASPVATLNRETLGIHSFNYSTSITYSDPILWLNPGDECQYTVDCCYKVFEETDILPAEFRITAPDTAFVLYYHDDLTVTWDVPACAEWYDLSVYCDHDHGK